MANLNVVVVDGNNINVQVTPTPDQVITIDRGIAGNGIESITEVDIDSYAYLDIVYTNGTTEQIGPIGVSSAILIEIADNMVSITAVADDLAVINDVYANLAAIQNCDTNMAAIIAAPVEAAAAAASASAALISENAAAASASDALASQNSTAAIYDQFDDRYLGAKAVNPTTDNDGNPLIVGALYFNTTVNKMRVWDGTSWEAAYVPAGIYLQISNNLSDVQSVSTARTNLGLGSAALLAAGAANGAATLDNAGTVPVSQLPAAVLGAVSYQGAWNAATNTPALASGVGTKGYYYVVSVAGSTNLDGITDWVVGDWAIYSGTAWQKIDNTELVTSVNGQIGTVVLSYADVGAASAAQGALANTAIQGLTSNDASIDITPSGTSVNIQVSQNSPASTLLAQVRNQTGATLTKGTIVYISGGSGNKALVSKALATSDATSANTFGMVTADIPNNQNGYVTISGIVSGLDTSAYPDGTILYLSGTTAGAYTGTKPYAPIHLVYVGVVTYSHENQGSIQTRIQNGYELDELHNVSAQTPITGQTIVYNSATNLWEKSTVSLTVGVNGTLPIANGGTGQTTANAAFNAFAPSQIGNGGKYLTTDGSNASWATNPLGTVTSVNASGGTTGLTFSGGPVTSSGTLAMAGTLAIANGGTGQTTAAEAITALTGAQTSGQYLRSNGTNSALSAIQASDVPTLNQNTTGSAATLTTARTLTIGSTGKTFNGSANVEWTLSEIGAAPSTAPQVTVYTSGSGTYTTPTGCRFLEIEMVGAGGGGGGSGGVTGGGSGGNGGNAGSTTINSILIVAGGGAGGAGGEGTVGMAGGAGGAASGTANILFSGQSGTTNGEYNNGGSAFTGGGTGGACAFGASGGDGGGAGGTGAVKGAGGGGGAYCSSLITSPASSYTYAVGAGGTAGTAGTNSGIAGQAGRAGLIIFTAYF